MKLLKLGEVKMSELLLYNDKIKKSRIDPLHIRIEELQLANLCCAVKEGYTDLIEKYVRHAFDEGLSADELLEAVSGLIEDGPSLAALMEFLRALRYEENDRREPISVFDENERED